MLALSALTESALADCGAPQLTDNLLACLLSRRRFASFLELQMPQGRDFSCIDIGETVTGAIDFANWLSPGATIASVSSVAAANYFPLTTGSAYVNLTGSATIGTVPTSEGGSGIANTAVLQQWIGANVGTARITVTITTSDGQTLIGWAHQPVGQPS